MTSSRKDTSMVIEDADVILFDGILIFYWEELRDLFDLKVINVNNCYYATLILDKRD